MWDLGKSLKTLSTNKLLIGMMMIILNVCSRYIELGFTKTQEQALRNGLGRELLIFAVAFIGSRDIATSIMLTAAFIVLSDYLLNDSSSLCVMPVGMKELADRVDTNGDNVISPEEERKFMAMLRKAKAGEL